MAEGYCVTYTGISARMNRELLTKNYNHLKCDSYLYNFYKNYKGDILKKSKGNTWEAKQL